MSRHLIIGANWDRGLVERLEHAIPGWRVSLAANTDFSTNGASVLVPFGMTVDRELLSNSDLKLIQQFGVGLDSVDLNAARDLGVVVANAPSAASGMAEAVAEGAVLLTLSCARLPSKRAENLKQRRWNWVSPLNLGLRGKTVGLVGYGSIGQAIAKRLKAFDMRVCAVRRSVNQSVADELEWIGRQDRLHELVSNSDFIVICAPLTPETRGLFNHDLIQNVKKGASIINVGRGPIIDEKSLIQALDEEHLYAAGLDTVSIEPLPHDSPLLSHPRIVITPHEAGVTELAFDGVANIIADNLSRLEDGRPLQYRRI